MDKNINLINNYYLFSCLLNDKQEKRKLLNILLNIYNTKYDELDVGFIDFNNSELNDFVESIENYNTILRMQEYYHLNHLNDEEIKNKYLNIKGEALQIINKLDLDSKTSPTTIYLKLFNLKLQGNINAIKILGFFSYYGFIINQNTNLGIECFKYLLNWNNDFGKRILIYNNIKFNLDEKCIELFNELSNNLIINKTTINYQIYNVLYSNILNIFDKRKLLLSKNIDYLTIFNTMPLTINNSNINYNLSPLSNIIIKRDDELSIIKKELSNINYRTNNSYLPLSILVNSKTIKDDYISNISKVFNESVVIEVDNNFNLTKLLKFIKKDENIFIFDFKDNLEQPIIDFFLKFLVTYSRSKTDLSGIEIDFSSVVPICIGSERIINKFRLVSKVIKIKDLNSNEKQKMIQSYIDNKKNEFKLNSITNNITCYDNISIDNLIIAVDKYLYENKDNKNIYLTDEVFKDYVSLNSNSYGFGGGYNVYSR